MANLSPGGEALPSVVVVSCGQGICDPANFVDSIHLSYCQDGTFGTRGIVPPAVV